MTTLVKRGTARRLGLRPATTSRSDKRWWVAAVLPDGKIEFRPTSWGSVYIGETRLG